MYKTIDKKVVDRLYKLSWIILIMLSFFLRVYNLEERSMSHDESLHTFFSWQYSEHISNLFHRSQDYKEVYKHDPMMHGPLLFHMNALVYSIFKADDFTSRIVPAIFGVFTVVAFLFFIPFIGRSSALFSALFCCFSPDILYYSRYIRNDIYICFFSLVLVFSLFQYIETSRIRWVLLFSLALGLSIATKEVAFIFALILGVYSSFVAFAYYLCSVLKGKDKDFYSFFAAKFGDISILILTSCLFFSFPILSVLLNNVLPESLRLFTYHYQAAIGYKGFLEIFRSLLLVLVSCTFVSIAWFGILRKILLEKTVRVKILKNNFLIYAAYSLLITLFFLIAIFGFDLLDLKYLQTYCVVLVSLLGFSACLLIVNSMYKHFMIKEKTAFNFDYLLLSLLLFLLITSALFTSMYSNVKGGLITGFIGSVGYWLEQHSVQRGSQPIFYYTMLLSLYSLALVFLGIYGTYDIVKRVLKNNFYLLKTKSVEIHFEIFCIWWFLASLLAYTLAGEKMPWLLTHISLPLCFLAGKGLNKMVEFIYISCLKNKKDVINNFIFIISFLVLLLTFKGISLESLRQVTHNYTATSNVYKLEIWRTIFFSLLALVFLIKVLAGAQNIKLFLRQCLYSVFLLFTFQFFKTSLELNYINFHSAREHLVYAHASQDVKRTANYISLLQKYNKRNELLVSYDMAWPFYWYFIKMPNTVFYNDVSNLSFSSKVILSENAKLDAIRDKSKKKLSIIKGNMIWWPVQTYMKYAEPKNRFLFLEDMQNKQFRNDLYNIFLNRSYEYYKDSEWPLRNEFNLIQNKDYY